jgi:hypothetical protein
VDYRADFLNMSTAYKLKLPHLSEGGVDQAAGAERQKKGKKHYPQTNNLLRL